MYAAMRPSDSDNPVVTAGERLKVMATVLPRDERELGNAVYSSSSSSSSIFIDRPTPVRAYLMRLQTMVGLQFPR